ncbi:hypothetical protein MASR2M39_21340 [Ignavibacteriales bacterium]
MDSLPELLTDIVHCNFSDSDKFDSEFTKLKNTILDIPAKPPVMPGSNLLLNNEIYSDLTSNDNLMLNTAVGLY